MNLCIYISTHMYVYIDMFISRKIIHGVMPDPAEICTGPSEPWAAIPAVPVQGDTRHYPCGTGMCHHSTGFKKWERLSS